METFIKVVFGAAAGIILVAVVMFFIGALLAWPVFWIWNYMMPELFALPMITWWQAFWGTFLCGLLFKSSNIQSSK